MIKIIALLSASLWAEDRVVPQIDDVPVELMDFVELDSVVLSRMPQQVEPDSRLNENGTTRRRPGFSMPTPTPTLVVQSAPGADNAADGEGDADNPGGSAGRNSADVPTDLPSVWVEVSIKRDLYIRNALHIS